MYQEIILGEVASNFTRDEQRRHLREDGFTVLVHQDVAVLDDATVGLR